jgi:hypothetical protein
LKKIWKKFRTLCKNALFLYKFFSSFVSNQRKTLLKMATSTFRVGDHIFFICYLKNHMTWICDFWSKMFGNILKIFLISCSKILILVFWIHRQKILRIPLLFLSNISLVCFFTLGHTLNHNYPNKLRFGRNKLKASLIENKEMLFDSNLSNC